MSRLYQIGTLIKHDQYIFLGTFRFCLALSVFISHTEQYKLLIGVPINWGGLGVWLFFVVSGYVIFSAHDLFYRGRVGIFLANRALRIFPTVWVCLLISFGVLAMSDAGVLSYPVALPDYETLDFLLSISVIGGFLTPDAWAPLPPASTLTIETKFYLIAAALFVLRRYVPLQESHFMFGAGLVFLGLYVAIELTGGQYRIYGALRYGPLFVLGAAAYYVHRSEWRSKAALVMLALSYIFTLHFCLSMESSSGYVGLGFREDAMKTAALLSFLLAFFLVVARFKLNGSQKNIDRQAGDLTYPFYLVQYPLIVSYEATIGIETPADFIILLLATTLAAIIINQTIERPLLALRRRWRRAL